MKKIYIVLLGNDYEGNLINFVTLNRRKAEDFIRDYDNMEEGVEGCKKYDYARLEIWKAGQDLDEVVEYRADKGGCFGFTSK